MRIGLIEIAITTVVLGFIFKDKLFQHSNKNNDPEESLEDESDIIEGEIITDDANSKQP